MKKQYATYPLNLRTLDQEQTYQLIKALPRPISQN